MICYAVKVDDKIIQLFYGMDYAETYAQVFVGEGYVIEPIEIDDEKDEQDC